MTFKPSMTRKRRNPRRNRRQRGAWSKNRTIKVGKTGEGTSPAPVPATQQQSKREVLGKGMGKGFMVWRGKEEGMGNKVGNGKGEAAWVREFQAKEEALIVLRYSKYHATVYPKSSYLRQHYGVHTEALS